jgi:hypothetical protein
MNKLSILLLGLALTTLVTGQCDNPLIAKLGMATSTSVLTPGSGGVDALTKCTSLTKTCCTSASINAIQTAKIDAFITSLTADVKTRDTALLAARKAVAAKSTTLIAFKNASIALATHFLTATPVTGGQAISDDAVEYEGYITDVITNYDTIHTGYATYRTTRKTCVEQILKTQASAYCLACSEDPVTANGVDASGEITLASTAADTLRTACFDYLSNADAQNVIFKVYSLLDKFEAMTAALVLITADDVAGVAAYNTAKGTPSTTNVIVELPGSCTSTASCDWITDTLFPPAGLFDQVSLVRGGQEAARRVLEQGRLLAGEWAADEVSGVTATFPEDPSGLANPTDSMSAVIRNGVISCIAAVFVTLLV